MPGPWGPLLSGRPRRAEDLIIIERRPALVRTASGLLLRDDFSIDTEANYIAVGHDHWAVASGSLTWTPDGGGASGSGLRRDELTRAKCVTAKVTQSGSGWCNNNPVNVGSSGDGDPTYHTPNGYGIQLGQGTATGCYLYKTVSAVETQLDVANTATRTLGTAYLWRIYIAAGTIYGKFGETALANFMDGVDSTYTEGNAAIFANDISGRNVQWDYFDVRTSYQVIVTGLASGYYAKVSDGTTTAKALASSGTATIDAGLVLFPLASVQVYDGDPDTTGTLVIEITSTELADMGGGDTFAFAGGTASILGDTTAHSDTDTYAANQIQAMFVHLGEGATVASISGYVKWVSGTDAQLRFLIYRANGPGGGPGTLCCWTAVHTILSSETAYAWHTENIIGGNANLPPGDYYLVHQGKSGGYDIAQLSSAYGLLPGWFASETWNDIPFAPFCAVDNAWNAHNALYATYTPWAEVHRETYGGTRRLISGLLLRDDFTTDTESLYARSGLDYWAVSGGAMVATNTADGDTCLYRPGVTKAKVVTVRWKSTVAGNYCNITTLGGSGPYGGYYANGYYLMFQTSTFARLGVVGGGDMDSATVAAIADNTWYYLRTIIHAGNVSAKWGTTALANTDLDMASATFVDGQVSMGNYTGTSQFDFLEARTSHQVIVTGLPSGYYVKVSDGTTTAKAAASSGTATVDAGLVLFPLSYLRIYDADPDTTGVLIQEITSSVIADMGGGDVFDYSPVTWQDPGPFIDGVTYCYRAVREYYGP